MSPAKTSIGCPGYSLVADWYEGTSDVVLLVLPGYSSSRERQRALVESIVDATNCSALSIDYSGHGDSPFELRDTSPAQHLLEVVTTFDSIKAQHSSAKIWVFGTSYGGFLAAKLTEYRKFERLALRAPAIYPPEAFYDKWSIRIDNTERYEDKLRAYRKDSRKLAENPTLKDSSNFEGKNFVIVHEKDEIVPKETTDAYIRAFNADNFTQEGFPHSMNEQMKVESNESVLVGYHNKIAQWFVG